MKGDAIGIDHLGPRRTIAIGRSHDHRPLSLHNGYPRGSIPIRTRRPNSESESTNDRDLFPNDQSGVIEPRPYAAAKATNAHSPAGVAHKFNQVPGEDHS